MGVRGKAAHVDADLGQKGLGAEVVEARNGLYDLGGLTKGVEIGLHLLVDPRDRPIEGVDLLQMELEQEAVVSRQAAPQRLAKLFWRGSDPPVRQPGQDNRIGLAGDHRLDHGPTANAQDVGDDRVRA